MRGSRNSCPRSHSETPSRKRGQRYRRPVCIERKVLRSDPTDRRSRPRETDNRCHHCRAAPTRWARWARPFPSERPSVQAHLVRCARRRNFREVCHTSPHRTLDVDRPRNWTTERRRRRSMRKGQLPSHRHRHRRPCLCWGASLERQRGRRRSPCSEHSWNSRFAPRVATTPRSWTSRRQAVTGDPQREPTLR